MFAMRKARRTCRGQTVAIFLHNRFPAFFAHTGHEIASTIERQHFDVKLTAEVEKRPIEICVKTPDFAPFSLFQKQLGFKLACHPFIKHWLNSSWKHLKANGKLIAKSKKRGRNIHLPTVNIVSIMLFAQENHALLGHFMHDRLMRASLRRLWTNPMSGLHR